MIQQKGWIGVDLDGTLAVYDGWKGEHHIGAPVEPILKEVRALLDQGVEVRIFTARVAEPRPGVVRAIEDWCVEHLGVALPVTCQKDFRMVELWDDRARQVLPNLGVFLDQQA